LTAIFARTLFARMNVRTNLICFMHGQNTKRFERYHLRPIAIVFWCRAAHATT